ncbi:MAG: ECF transporter S component [Spirochaetes bacterium]|nr:ECF transporter S component [Spirochaetota bacterium]
MSKSEKSENPEKFSNTIAFRIASIVILTAIVTIFTIVIRIPVAPTGGFLNLSDIAIFFTAFVFGPISALFAAGLGTAIANLIAGFGQYAPVSLVTRGLQGLLVGLVYNAFVKDGNYRINAFLVISLCFLVGASIMISGYFIAQIFMVGPGAALVEVPLNFAQALAGILGGTALAAAVKKAYPPVIHFRW